MSELSIRNATINDASLILKFVKELARYEKAEHEVLASEKHIKENMLVAMAESTLTNDEMAAMDGLNRLESSMPKGTLQMDVSEE